MTHRLRSLAALISCLIALPLLAENKKSKAVQAQGTKSAAPQIMDEEYTKLIKQYLQDPRVTTELVDHMPVSATVPSPLKFFGRIPGTPGELTYAKDIYRYYEALAKASPRALFWKIGQSEEGRDQVVLAIADEATIKDLAKYKDMLASLTDPRKTTEEQARQLIKTAKPLYWANSGIHSPETGGPEMLIELAYRLIIEETPFIQAIRNNVITFITPVIEVDGREKQVDTYYYGKKTSKQRPPLMYWGKYVAHDNNRDGMGQYLKLTQNMTKTLLEWHPTILHDLHEAQSYLYVSTGTGPYNNSLDPIQVNEWWLLAETEVMEMAKRNVPGVWTYGFYDGWVPNYLFWIAITHNSFGRFYEVQSYGPDIVENLRLQPTVTSREWFRPNPPLPSIKWGPRNNTNIQESALLFAMHQVALNKELYLENYWMKNKRSVETGKAGPTFAWVIPAGQRRKTDTVDMVNALRHQGLEIHKADAAFKAGNVDVAAGDYVIRADQPYRTMADMYFSVQNYPPANPRPYDDTGWTMQFMRNVKLTAVTDKEILNQPMTMLAADAKPAGSIAGSGNVLVVDHTTDNALMAFRFKNAGVKMLAAEDDFELSGHKFRAGAFIVPSADRARLDPSIQELGLAAWAVASPPDVKTHALDVPRIGYVHAWQRTQDEGWTRAALDYYGVPYTYFSDQKLREGNLRAKYDVIIYPHVGGTSQSHLNGIPKNGADPIPYKKSDLTPNLGALDQSDDIRGGMGIEGLAELAKFVQEGGTLIADGSSAAFLAEYGLAGTVTVEHPAQLFARGSILRGTISDQKSPIAYGFEGKDLPVYFSQDPVFSAGGGFGGFGGGGGGFGVAGGPANAGAGQNVTPNAVPLQTSPWDSAVAPKTTPVSPADEAADFRVRARGMGIIEDVRPRVVMQFPTNANDMLLSGTLAGGQALSGRALALDVPVGKGHIVMFALRPFWRWQTQGTYFLAFNAILNWNHLDAGKAEPRRRNSTATSDNDQ
jgi:Zinc carboxypeptidase